MSERYRKLMDRVRAGEQVMIDGGTGSEMDQRGVERSAEAWTGASALSHPEIVRSVHDDYLAAGANVIIANTFATHKGVLRDAGTEHDFEALNRRSVEIAVAARDAGTRPDVVVAAGMSHWSFTGNETTLDQLEQDAREQADIMAAAGAELLILEMMITVDRMLRVLIAAASTGLPVWVGITIGEEDGSLATPGVMALADGTLLADAIAALEGFDVDVLAIMHTDVRLVDACLDIVDVVWDRPIAVYAHSGEYVDGEWTFTNVISPTAYAELCAGWVERGVHVIGGCCGTRPEHMHAIARLEGVS